MDDFDRMVSSRLSRFIGPKDETELDGDKLACSRDRRRRNGHR
jgi:hypothetical protein